MPSAVENLTGSLRVHGVFGENQMVDQKVIVLDGTRREDDDLTSVLDVLIDAL